MTSYDMSPCHHIPSYQIKVVMLDHDQGRMLSGCDNLSYLYKARYCRGEWAWSLGGGSLGGWGPRGGLLEPQRIWDGQSFVRADVHLYRPSPRIKM